MIRRSTTAADFADGAAAEPAATAAAAGAGTANVQTADIAAGGAVAAEKAGVPAAGASGRPTGFRMRPSLRPHAASTVVAALHLPTVALSERRSPRLRAREAPAMKGTEAKTAAVRGIAAVAAAVAAEKAARAKHLKRLPAAEAAERRNRCRTESRRTVVRSSFFCGGRNGAARPGRCARSVVMDAVGPMSLPAGLNRSIGQGEAS